MRGEGRRSSREEKQLGAVVGGRRRWVRTRCQERKRKKGMVNAIKFGKEIAAKVSQIGCSDST